MTSISLRIGAAVLLLGIGHGQAMAASQECGSTSGGVRMTVHATDKPTEFKVTSGPADCTQPSTGDAPPKPEPVATDRTMTPVDHPGQSWGGKLRKGPGMEFPQVGSLYQGSPLTIVGNSGVAFNDYDWFEVRLPSGKTGFQWGGILCSVGDALPGVFGICPSR